MNILFKTTATAQHTLLAPKPPTTAQSPQTQARNRIAAENLRLQKLVDKQTQEIAELRAELLAQPKSPSGHSRSLSISDSTASLREFKLTEVAVLQAENEAQREKISAKDREILRLKRDVTLAQTNAGHLRQRIDELKAKIAEMQGTSSVTTTLHRIPRVTSAPITRERDLSLPSINGAGPRPPEEDGKKGKRVTFKGVPGSET